MTEARQSLHNAHSNIQDPSSCYYTIASDVKIHFNNLVQEFDHGTCVDKLLEPIVASIRSILELPESNFIGGLKAFGHTAISDDKALPKVMIMTILITTNKKNETDSSL